jgi:hypothetical protein
LVCLPSTAKNKTVPGLAWRQSFCFSSSCLHDSTDLLIFSFPSLPLWFSFRDRQARIKVVGDLTRKQNKRLQLFARSCGPSSSFLHPSKPNLSLSRSSHSSHFDTVLLRWAKKQKSLVVCYSQLSVAPPSHTHTHTHTHTPDITSDLAASHRCNRFRGPSPLGCYD